MKSMGCRSGISGVGGGGGEGGREWGNVQSGGTGDWVRGGAGDRGGGRNVAFLRGVGTI